MVMDSWTVSGMVGALIRCRSLKKWLKNWIISIDLAFDFFHR
jgi:hypothetical protein